LISEIKCFDCEAILQEYDDLQKSKIALTAKRFCKNSRACEDRDCSDCETTRIWLNEIQENRSSADQICSRTTRQR
jgi:hypothetical protein